MKREIIEVDKERGIVRWTAPDERWYARKVMGEWDFVPSVTWICGAYPKGKGFERWLANRSSWQEAEELKELGGDKGSKVHQAIGVLLSGGTVLMDDAFENPRSHELEPLTSEEYWCLMTFVDWFRKFQPQVVAFEYTVWNERYRYAGTVDLKCVIQEKGKWYRYIIDFKISKDVWPAMELQVSAYKHADPDPTDRLAILQLGYRRNRQGWKFNPVRSQFGLFLSTRKIWAKETAGIVPLQRDYPESLSLNPVMVEAQA